MTMRPTAILTEANVVAILERLKQKIPHRIIAAEFGVSKKTISRINTGETWREVSLRYGTRPIITPVISLVGLSPEFCDAHDEMIAIKNHFALSFQQPLYWGWFEGWDGLHSLVSDGYIIWESADLVKYAQKIGLKELPTFELEALMTRPVGERFDVGMCTGDIVRLTNSVRTVFLRQKYVTLAAKMKLDIRESGKESIVYLTKNKPKSKSDPMPIIIAAVATVQEM